MIRITISLLMALLSTLVFASETEYSVSHARVQKFLTILLGQWDGEAIETPVGPVDYDRVQPVARALERVQDGQKMNRQ
jgi:hypothetical protein